MLLIRAGVRWRFITRDLFCLCLLCSWTVQIARPQTSSAISDIHDFVCRSISGLNEAQIELCKDVPQAISVLAQADEIFASECTWQFRKERWNCSGLSGPIFSEPMVKDTKESAFVYALSSALTVHQITSACSSGELAPKCGCDTSRNGLTTVQGWKWGSCSDNVSYGVTYSQQFLDSRELDNDVRSNEEVTKAIVHLHNNAAGRRLVADNMKLACRCHGFSGSCSVKTCWRELPSLYEVGDKMKEMYDHAIKVEAHVSRDGSPAFLQYYSEDHGSHIIPSESDIVYVEDSPRYCSDKSNFTSRRHCMPQGMLSGDVYQDTSMGEFYPPCETFCCNGQYESYQRTEAVSCNCTFVWCCKVVCETCVRNVTEYRCTG